MADEFLQKTEWKTMGRYQVSSELFLDVVYTSACDCSCPYCIARTKAYASFDQSAWEQAVLDAFRLFPVKNVIILGGEATVDPEFWQKTEFLTRAMKERTVDHLILTTNGNAFRNEAFLDRLLASRIDAVNLSRMHHDQAENDRLFGYPTLSKEEIGDLYRRLRSHGKTLRLNVNVWKNNLDSPEQMDAFVRAFAGHCDAIKFTPLMRTDLFDTEEEVTRYTRERAMTDQEIACLWDAFLAEHTLIRKTSGILGFVDYAEARAFGQRVILKYSQVEDKYDRETMIPTLKLYPNGCLSNEWSFTKDIRSGLKRPIH